MNSPRLNTQEKANHILDYVCEISGNPELPVRTSFELTASLRRFFSTLEKNDEHV